jgi:DNA processing protein
LVPERIAPWLALHLLPGVGPVSVRRALSLRPDPEEVAFRWPASAWSEVPGVDGATAEGLVAARPSLARRIEAEWRAAARRNVRIVTPDMEDYPAMIAALHDAPIVLYVRGEVPEGRVRVALVGARRASAYGREVARGLSADLAARGVEVVSGGARGVDTCAHRAALGAGGRTVAVMGAGLACAYPAENEDLFDAIAASGALISEFPMAMQPLAENFPRRNRLIAALCAATVVIEARARSGSLITAGHALEYGREVMAVPGPVTSENSAGCHRLIQQGAKLVTTGEDVLEELSPMYRDALEPLASPAPAEAPPGVEPTADEAAVLTLFDDPRPVHIDRLAEAAPFGMARLNPALLGLVLGGRLDPLPGGYYVARPRKGPVEP